LKKVNGAVLIVGGIDDKFTTVEETKTMFAIPKELKEFFSLSQKEQGDCN